MGVIVEALPLRPRPDIGHSVDRVDNSCGLYLPLRKLSGDSFYSHDHYRQACIVTGALWTPSGRRFDGVDDFINAQATPTLNGAREFTILAWIYPTAAGTLGAGGTSSGIVQRGTGNNVVGYTILHFDNNRRFRFTAHQDSPSVELSLVGNLSIGLNEKHHVAARATFNNMEIYVGGLLDAYVANGHTGLTPLNPGTSDHPTNCNIGRYNYDNATNIQYFTGFIAEVKFYSRALLPAEIMNHYLAQKGIL